MDYIRTQFKTPYAQEYMLKILVITLSAILFAFILTFIINKLISFENLSFNSHSTAPTVLAKPVITAHPIITNNHLPATAWHVITITRGDTLSTIFSKVGLTKQTLKQLLSQTTFKYKLLHLIPHQQITFKINHQHHLQALIFPLNATQNLMITHRATRYISRIKRVKILVHPKILTVTIHDSLYIDGEKQQISPSLLQQLIQIFAWQIDFTKDLQSGDNFTILYEEYYAAKRKVGIGHIIAAEFTNQGETYQAIRFINKHGESQYYTATGTSLNKAFTRFPIRYTHISSPYNLHRWHPILHISRPHLGVDFAAPLGTPIYAAGNGKIIFIGRHGGYGNLVKIKHNHCYTTLYAHLLRFYKGLQNGSMVKQGQLIGYVGQSGMANGPHLHYEFRIYDKPVNPLAVNLPMTASVPKTKLAWFKTKAHTLIAQLESYHHA